MYSDMLSVPPYRIQILDNLSNHPFSLLCSSPIRLSLFPRLLIGIFSKYLFYKWWKTNPNLEDQRASLSSSFLAYPARGALSVAMMLPVYPQDPKNSQVYRYPPDRYLRQGGSILEGIYN